jgi:hypothetical protein
MGYTDKRFYASANCDLSEWALIPYPQAYMVIIKNIKIIFCAKINFLCFELYLAFHINTKGK